MTPTDDDITYGSPKVEAFQFLMNCYQELESRRLVFALVLPPALDEVAPEHLVAVNVLLNHIKVLSPGGTRSFVILDHIQDHLDHE